MHAKVDNPELIESCEIRNRKFIPSRVLYMKIKKNKKHVVIGGSRKTNYNIYDHAMHYYDIAVDYMYN
jgi:hypothetical protein